MLMVKTSLGDQRLRSPYKHLRVDSQRLVFFIPSLGFVFTVAWFRLVVMELVIFKVIE